MQRILGGRLRGRKLLTLPAGVAGLRPTGVLVRRSIFDRIGPAIEGAQVLDLFGGSGALSIEALSRGARRATIIEKSKKVARFLQDQLQRLELDLCAQVHHADAHSWLGGPATRYDIVFIDPPFAMHDAFAPLASALCKGWLSEKALIVCERERVRGKTIPVSWPPSLRVESTRIHGQAVVEYLRWSLTHNPGQANERSP